MSEWTNKSNLSSAILFIFDLDDTLVPQTGSRLFHQVDSVLRILYKHNIILTIASYNNHSHYYLQHNNIHHYFDKIEGYQDLSKRIHINNILRHYPDIPHSKICFFDDSKRNIDDIKKSFTDIKSIHVDRYQGITFNNIMDSLLELSMNDSEAEKTRINDIIMELYCNDYYSLNVKCV